MKYKKIITLGLGLIASTIFYSCASAPNVSYSPVSAPSLSSPSSEGGSLDYAKSQKAKRPGLGTGWGYAKSSKVKTSYFNRSNKPYGEVETIYYNDEEGLDAMIGKYRYGKKGLQQSSNGLVEWGVKQGLGTLKSYYRGGKRFVEGGNGRTYSIVVKNICHARIEAVVSVDGLDVMNGRGASTKNRGYVINPGKIVEIKGFRTSEDAVAAFKFSSVASSYSAEKYDTTRNVGVIGLAVFPEEGVDPWKWSTREIKDRTDASPFAAR